MGISISDFDKIESQLRKVDVLLKDRSIGDSGKRRKDELTFRLIALFDRELEELELKKAQSGSTPSIRKRIRKLAERKRTCYQILH